MLAYRTIKFFLLHWQAVCKKLEQKDDENRGRQVQAHLDQLMIYHNVALERREIHIVNLKKKKKERKKLI